LAAKGQAEQAAKVHWEKIQPLMLDFFNNMMMLTWLSFITLFFGF